MTKTDNIKKVITICLAIFSAIFINLSLSKNTGIYYSLKGNSIMYIIYFICFYYILNEANKIKDKRMTIISIALAIILAGFEVIGKSIDTYLNLSGVLKNNITILKSIIKLISLSIILYSIIKLIYHYILAYNTNYEKEKLIKFFTSNKKSFFITWGVIIICWIPYFLRFYPGNATADSISQVLQGLGLKNISNHHPVFHTFIIAIMMNIGKLLNNYNIGIAMYSIVQLIIMSGIFAYTIYYMAKKNINIIVRFFTLIFYAIYPVHAMYSITMWKDILFAGVMLLFVINICDMVTDEYNFFKKKKRIILFIINMILVFLFRNNGIYVIVLSAPFIILIMKKYYKKLIIAFATVLFIYFIFNGPIFKILNIEKGSIKEALSIPLQQFARVTRDHEKELTDEEKNSIYNFLPVDNLGELYYEKISDMVKNNFADEYFANNKFEFLKTWIKLGIKYPRTYIESFLCNSYGYWYPETINWVLSNEILKPGDKVEESLNLKQTPIINSSKIDTITQEITSRKIPILSMIFSIGFIFWIFIIMLGYNIYKKQYKKCLIYLPVLILWLTCLASPVFCEFRYIYSLFTCLPILIGINFINKESN